MKGLWLSLIFTGALNLTLATSSLAADETTSDMKFGCGTTQPCEDEAKILGAVALGVAGLILPHFLAGGSMESGLSQMAIGAGAHDLKEISADVASFFPDQDRWFLRTTGSLTIYNKTLPTILRYGVGPGVQLPQAQGKWMADVQAVAEKYEALDETQLGLLEKLTYVWEPSDRNHIFIAAANAQFFKNSYSLLRADLGIRHRFGRKSDPVNLAPLGGAMVSYQDNQFLQQKSVIFSLLIDL
jgi:hypothetical protein